MDKEVSTDTLFIANKDYSKLSYEDKRQYVNDLCNEFMVIAKELLESLKDK